MPPKRQRTYGPHAAPPYSYATLDAEDRGRWRGPSTIISPHGPSAVPNTQFALIRAMLLAARDEYMKAAA